MGARLRVGSRDDRLHVVGTGLVAAIVCALPTYAVILGGRWTVWEGAVPAAYVSAAILMGFAPRRRRST